MALARDTRLRIGTDAVLRITGLRSPCAWFEHFRRGLVAEFPGKDAAGRLILKAGIMAVVETGGLVRTGDPIRVEHPPLPHIALEWV